MKARVAALFAISAAWPVVAISAPGSHLRFLPSDPKETLPPWDYVEMVSVVVNQSSAWFPRWRASDVEALELLAWSAKVDDRPVYVNYALFGARLRGKRWALAMLAQNPVPDRYMPQDERAKATRWGFVNVRDPSWSGPVAVFNKPPTRAEVDYFLNGWDWPDERWVSLTEGVRPQAWKAIFNELPPPKMIRPSRSRSK
jgi:hypothetical protein